MADFTLDARQAFATFDAIERRLAELEGAMRRTQNTSKTVFTGGLDSARKEIQTLDQVQREYQELDQMVNRFKANLRSAWDPRAVATYTRAIEEAEIEMRRLEHGAKAVGVSLKKSLSQEEDTKSFGASILSGLKGAALAAGAGISFGAAISEGIALNAEYERIKTSLTVILKDAGKAEKLLGKLNQFAAETPFQSDQINKAATSLLAFGVGEDEVIDKLREIGTVSAATGKDFNELATIYGKARVAGVLYAEDINQLVEAGVPIIGEFAKQLGVSESQVKKLASQGKIGFNELESAFKNLTGEGGRFDGLLQKQSETLQGVASTLKDLFSQGLRKFFAPIAESLRDGGKALIAFLNPVQATSAAFVEQSRKVENLNKNLVPLLDRYDELTRKTNPTKKEQAELGEVIKKIGVITPGAITEIDKYGNALSVNADKSRAFLAAERARLKFVNEEAIKTVQSAKDQAEQEAKILQARVKSGKQVVIETGAGGGGLFGAGSATSTAREVTLTAKQIEDITKKVAELTERAKGADAELKRLKGETPEPDKKPTPTPTPTAGAGGESAAAKQFKKDLADLEKVAATLEQVRAAVAPDDLSEDLARVNKKYDDLVKATEEGILKLQQIEKRRGITPEQRAQLEELSAFTVQLEERRLDELTSVLLDFNEKEIALADEQEKRKKALAEKVLQGDKEAIQEQKNIRDDAIKLQEERGKQLIAVLKKAGADEKEMAALQRQFDLATQKAQLESELQFQQQLLSIIGAGNEAQAAEIKRTIAQLKAEIGTLSVEIDTPQVSGGGKKQNLFDLLGIDTSTDAGAEFAEQVEEMAGRAIAALQDMAQARTELAQQEVESSDNRISTLESELDREIQLAELGFASNVTLKRKQLEEEKKKNAAVKAELERAKKSQLAIDTAIQASSLITSIANLFKSLSQLPFGTGIPIAIALSGLMIGFFIKSKIDAAKATKARFGKSSFITSDGIVEGRTHAQGGQLLEVERGEMVQVGDDGGRRRVEVVRRERAREYFDLLKAANKGDRLEIAQQALKLADISSMPLQVRARLYPSVNIREMYEEIPTVSRKKVLRRVFGSDKMQAIQVTVNGGDTTQTNRLLEQIIRLHIESAQAEKWSPDGMVRTKGNTKTRYR